MQKKEVAAERLLRTQTNQQIFYGVSWVFKAWHHEYDLR